jgi:dTDP-glucose 4,6-dehydratase
MRSGIPKLLITGGAGFIGSEFAKQSAKDYEIIIIDKLTYAGDLKRLNDIKGEYKFYKADICNKIKIDSIFKRERPEIVINFAAETHVDRSILAATPFIETNFKGTQVILDVSRKYKIKKIIHISTDEVYGETKKGSFIENSPLCPNSPYAASKAAADLLIKAYARTYYFPAIIVRPCNNYGPAQHSEKLIPLAILKASKKQKVPVYGSGKNIREWLFVSDCVEAILLVLKKGRIGEIYNIGSGWMKRNIDVVKQILDILGKPKNLIAYVKDRPGHDFRYSLNSEKIRNELAWRAKTSFEDGLKYTINWYINNKLKRD